MDEMSEERWSLICTPILGAGQTPIPEVKMPGAIKNQEALRTEYLKSVFQDHSGRWFSTVTLRAGMDDAGAPNEREEKTFFQIVKLVTDRSRPHVMPTVQSRKDAMARARLALNIQQASEKLGIPVADDTTVVHTDCDPEWIDWKDLGEFHRVRSTLTRYSVVASADHRACLELSNPEKAVPKHALLDSRTPCLVLLGELYRRGWKPSEGRVVHETAAISLMDGREAVKMKPYYHVLLEVVRCFPLTSEIPSDEPLLFYKLLLDGVHVEPYLGNPAYAAIKAGDPLPEPAAEIEDEEGSDDDEICVFGKSPPPKARAKGAPPAVPIELLLEGPIEDLDPRGPLREADAKAKRKARPPKAKGPGVPGSKAPAAPPPPAGKSRPPLPPPPGRRRLYLLRLAQTMMRSWSRRLPSLQLHPRSNPKERGVDELHETIRGRSPRQSEIAERYSLMSTLTGAPGYHIRIGF